MKNLILFLPLLLIFSCSKKSERDITITHKLMYNGAPLVMLKTYDYPDGKSMQLSKVSYYCSEMTVLGDGESVELSAADFIDFGEVNNSENAAAIGIERQYKDVDIETIEEVKFNLGLTPEQNAKTPGDYSSGHPLAKSGEYWEGWKSYVFAKIEGTIDLDGDGEREKTFALHLGSDEIRRGITVGVTGDTADSSVFEMTIITDLYNVFNNNGIYDISARSNIHSMDHLTEANQLIDNWAGTLSFLR